METLYLDSVTKQFLYYKMLGEKAISQVPDAHLFVQVTPESNSIATIINHLWGNMRSRWTDFLTTDGEKEWRNRDAEFENNVCSRVELLARWNEGWACLFNALAQVQPANLTELIYIRNQGHTVLEAINRQLAHYPYHIGQLIFIARMLAGAEWQSLSIPKGESQQFNADKFAKPREKQHFTDDYLGYLSK